MGVVVALVMFLAAALNADLMTGLQGYWRAEGTGEDSSAAGRWLNMVGGGSYGAGLFGSAFAFPGDGSQYAQRPVSDAACDFGAGDFSIQAWVLYNSTANEQVVIEKWTGRSGPGWTFTKLATGKYRFHLTTDLLSRYQHSHNNHRRMAPVVCQTPGTDTRHFL